MTDERKITSLFYRLLGRKNQNNVEVVAKAVESEEELAERQKQNERQTNLRRLEQVFANSPLEIDLSEIKDPDSLLRVNLVYEIGHTPECLRRDSPGYSFADISWVAPSTEFNYIPSKARPSFLGTERYKDGSHPERYHPSENHTLFVPVKEIEKLGFKLEDIVDSINSSKIRVSTSDQCCYGTEVSVRVWVSNAERKRFRFQNIREINKLIERKNPEALELAGNKLAALQARRLAENRRNLRYSERSDPKEVIECIHRYHGKGADILKEKFLPTGVRQEIGELLANAHSLGKQRDQKLEELETIYQDGCLTPETINSKRKELISNYDSKIVKLYERRYELEKPLRELKEVLDKTNFGCPNKITREEYKTIYRAYRNALRTK